MSTLIKLGFRRGLGLGTTLAYQISSPASLCRLVYIHLHCGQLRSFFLCCCVSCTVAQLCAVVSLARLCGRPTSLTSVATSFEASFERLPCGIPSAECFVWSLHALSLSVSQTLISSSSVVCSRSATLDRATVLLLRWNPAGPYSGSHLESSGSSAPVSVSVHPSRCSDHLFREWNLFCFISFLQCLCVAVFWHCISAATSTFMYCSETSVLLDVLHLWQLQRSLQRVDDHVDILHQVHFVPLHTESGES